MVEEVDEDVDITTLPIIKKEQRVRRDKNAPKEPRDLSKAKDAGIRKIRLGTFEDTGKCKGFVFSSLCFLSLRTDSVVIV